MEKKNKEQVEIFVTDRRLDSAKYQNAHAVSYFLADIIQSVASLLWGYFSYEQVDMLEYVNYSIKIETMQRKTDYLHSCRENGLGIKFDS